MGLRTETILARTSEKAEKRRVKNVQKVQIAYAIGNLLVQGANLIPTEQVRPTNNEKPITDDKSNNLDTYKDKVIEILNKETFNKLPKELQEDIVNKYNSYKTIMNYNDDECARRLNNYLKALNSRETQKLMADYLEQSLETEEIEGLDDCPVVDVDADISKQKTEGSDEEFIQSLLNRGEGYIDMYDTNNDNKVDLQEFIALEAKDNRVELIASEKAATEAYFNLISGGDGIIDAKDFASHLSAIARLYDGNSKTTVDDITYKEWFGAQMVGSDENITRNYNIWRNGYQKALEQ